MMVWTRRATLAGLAAVAMAPRLEAETRNAYDFSFTSIDGDPLPLSDYLGIYGDLCLAGRVEAAFLSGTG